MRKYRFSFALLISASLILAACGSNAATPTAAPAQPGQPKIIVAEGQLQPAAFMDVAFNLGGQIAEVLVEEGATVTEGQVLARLVHGPELEAAVTRAAQEVLAAQQSLETLQTNAPVLVAQAKLAALTAQQQLADAQEALDELKQAQKDKPEADRPTDLQIAEAEAKVALAQVKLTGAQDYATKITQANNDPDQLAAAQARRDTAQAALTAGQAASANLELKAPRAGTVVGLTLKAGERANPNQPALTLVDFSQWVIKTNDLTELEVAGLSLGQKAEIIFDALPNVTVTGAVLDIAQRYQEARGDVTYTVTLSVDNPTAQMRWGMTASAQFMP